MNQAISQPVQDQRNSEQIDDQGRQSLQSKMGNLLINRSKLTEIRILIAVTAATLWRFRAFPSWRDVIADPSIVATLTAGPRSISLGEPVVGAASNTGRIVVAWPSSAACNHHAQELALAYGIRSQIGIRFAPYLLA